jgi:predicted DNA-binding protein
MKMAGKKTYGKTAGGVPITDELIEKLAKEAEDGFDVDEMLRQRRGRPPIGSGPATVESVRLDPELREALAARAESDEEATSTVIRRALRRYLEAG